MRKGEVLALRICDVHLDNGMIDVNKSWNGKKVTSVKNTASERRISVPTHVIDVVKDLIKHKKRKLNTLKRQTIYSVVDITTNRFHLQT